ncbi:MAG: hypothetical protein U1F67_24120 [Rubrivivax sp.]
MNSNSNETDADVIVVGAGQRRSSPRRASAREHGASVLMLEAAPRELRGGNSTFTAACCASPTTRAG